MSKSIVFSFLIWVKLIRKIWKASGTLSSSVLHVSFHSYLIHFIQTYVFRTNMENIWTSLTRDGCQLGGAVDAPARPSSDLDNFNSWFVSRGWACVSPSSRLQKARAEPVRGPQWPVRSGLSRAGQAIGKHHLSVWLSGDHRDCRGLLCGVWSCQTIRDSPPVLGSETATQWYQGSESWNISQLQLSSWAQKPRQNRKTLELFWLYSDLWWIWQWIDPSLCRAWTSDYLVAQDIIQMRTQNVIKHR